MELNQEILDSIANQFSQTDAVLVRTALSSVQLSDVWASRLNLDRTLQSILQLSAGEVEKVLFYSKCAKADFRDVIMWADENQGKTAKQGNREENGGSNSS